MGCSSTILLMVLLLGMGCAVEPMHVFAEDEPTLFALYINLDGHGGFTVDPESPWGPGDAEVFPDFPWPDPDYGDLYLYEYGTVVTVTIIGDGISNTTNTRYFYDGVTGYGDGGYTGASRVFQVTMMSNIEEDVEWRTQYRVVFAQSGITTDTGLNTIVTVAGFAKLKVELPFNGWYDYGASVTFSYSNPVPGTYDLVSTIMTRYDASGNLISSTPGATITVTGPCTITGTYLPRAEDGSTSTTTTSTGTGTTTATGAYTTGTGWGSGVPLWPPGGVPEIFSGFTETWTDLSEDWRDFWESITSGFGTSTTGGNGSSTGGGFGSFGLWLQGSILPGIPNWILLLGFFFLILLIAKRDKKKKRR